MDYGIKVTRDGYDAQTTIPDTATNIKKFTLLSEISLIKIKQSTKVTINNDATETIAHGLGYTPIVWVFMQNGSSNLVPVYDNTSSTYMYVDGTNLVIHNSNGASRDFYYYIFYDSI